MELSKAAEMSFTSESVVQMLEWGANPEQSPYTHKQIAEWCDRFWCQYLDVDAPEEIEKLLPILADVDAQWDLFLANTYSLEELRMQSFEQVRVPVTWFQDWLKQQRLYVAADAKPLRGLVPSLRSALLNLGVRIQNGPMCS